MRSNEATARRKLAVCAPLLATCILAVPAAAQEAVASQRIEALTVDDHQGTATVSIRAAGQAPKFSLFRLQSPTRIVIDMAGADVAGLRAPEDFAKDGLVAAVTATQFRGMNGTVGRVVVVLRGDAEIDAKAAGSAIVLRATRAAAPAQPEAPLRTAAVTKPAAPDAVPVIELTGDDQGATRAGRNLVDVAVREASGGSIVSLAADGAIDRYEIEEGDAPARLVIDLKGIAMGDLLKQGGLNRTFPTSAISAARIGKHGSDTRVVLDLRSGAQRYDVAQTDTGLSIVFSGPKSTTPAVQLTGATFEHKGGFWRLRMDVGGAVAVRTVANGPREKVIALDGARLAKPIDGASFRGGPVDGVRILEDKKDSVRVALALGGDVEHSVWQKDGAVYWDVRVKSEGAQLASAGAAASSDRAQPAAAPFSIGAATSAYEGMTARTYRGKKITIDLMDADIVNVIRLLGDVSGKNVVVSEEVKGRVTLKLKNVPWDQAMDVILKTKDLGQETKGGIIRVVPQSKLDSEREARLKLQEEREKKLPTTVRLIPVNYAVAGEMLPQVTQLLSPRGKAAIDARTNVIIVEDIRDNLEQAERLVRTLDTQTPQVMIEARMVEASTRFSRNLGIQWGGSIAFTQALGNPTGLIFPNNVTVNGSAPTTAGIAGFGNADPLFAVNLPASNVNSGLGMSLGSIGNIGVLNARITAAESLGQAKVISAPRVTTLNNKPARIQQGVDITIPTVTLNAITVQTIKANLELVVTPHVSADGSILMLVQIRNNVPLFDQRVSQVPAISTKEAQTEMLVKDGDTAVIGGIYTRQSGEAYDQTPFLGSIPILGWLFKSYSETDNRTEMLVFLSPRIINRNKATPSGGGL